MGVVHTGALQCAGLRWKKYKVSPTFSAQANACQERAGQQKFGSSAMP